MRLISKGTMIVMAGEHTSLVLDFKLEASQVVAVHIASGTRKGKVRGNPGAVILKVAGGVSRACFKRVALALDQRTCKCRYRRPKSEKTFGDHGA